MKKEPGYGEALKEIEEIIAGIENETVDVDVLTVRVKRAVELIKGCKRKLRKTQEELDAVLGEFEEDPVAQDGTGKGNALRVEPDAALVPSKEEKQKSEGLFDF